MKTYKFTYCTVMFSRKNIIILYSVNGIYLHENLYPMDSFFFGFQQHYTNQHATRYFYPQKNKKGNMHLMILGIV